MKTAASLCAVMLFAGCVSTPRIETPAANPNGPAGASAPMPRTLRIDPTTRKTDEIFAAIGADKLEGLKPMDHGGHGEVDHSKMQHAEQPMDHSKHEVAVPAAEAAPAAEKKALSAEMEKLSTEMKKTSEELNEVGKKPPTPAADAHQHHRP